jgi:hypothetical protein
VAKSRWVNYSGAAPILLPVSLVRYWRGFFLPAEKHDVADLELPEGRFKICSAFDSHNPKTDYDRACALGGIPAVQRLRVGRGYGLVFATEQDSLTWWPERLMLVNGGSLPKASLLRRVIWKDECAWRAAQTDFVLMNACEHGSNPNLGPDFEIHLEPGQYLVQWGQYGWADDDPSMILFQFVRRGSR